MPNRQSGSFDPTVGLRALSELVYDALVRMGMAPEPALAGGGRIDSVDIGAWTSVSPLLVTHAVDTTSTTPHRSQSRFGSALGRGGRRVTTSTPEPPYEDIDEEHAETWRLVQLAQAGDGEAFGQLYDRYVDTVYKFIYFRVNDRGLAEDFTSETFLRALRRITTISYQGRDIGAWFVTIARNIILDHVKSARNRLETTTGDVIEGPEMSPSTETAVLESLSSQHLIAAVKKLGDEQRECVSLRFIQGLSVSETAAVMGKNDGAIKALQHRAIKKLAELVGEELR